MGETDFLLVAVVGDHAVKRVVTPPPPPAFSGMTLGWLDYIITGEMTSLGSLSISPLIQSSFLFPLLSSTSWSQRIAEEKQSIVGGCSPQYNQCLILPGIVLVRTAIPRCLAFYLVDSVHEVADREEGGKREVDAILLASLPKAGPKDWGQWPSVPPLGKFPLSLHQMFPSWIS